MSSTNHGNQPSIGANCVRPYRAAQQKKNSQQSEEESALTLGSLYPKGTNSGAAQTKEKARTQRNISLGVCTQRVQTRVPTKQKKKPELSAT